MRQKDGKRKALKRPAGVSGDMDSLYDRVADILDRARANVVRSVNSEMVLAYWHIGREIVQLVQGGDDRAEYGRGLIDELSSRLTKRYGNGFSTTNLRYFRTFYQVYADREPEIRHTAGGVLEDLSLVVDQADPIRGFSPLLGWSHYRALMKVASGRSACSMRSRRKEKVGVSLPWSVRSTPCCLHGC